jgi:hypothetical protein
MKTTRLQVVLRHVEPAVTRVIDVPTSATLPELHEQLQAAIGWTDSHLHQFVTPQATYGMEIPGGDVWPEDQRDETSAHVADLGAEFEYHYDFGDGWIHDVKVLGSGGTEPDCVDGQGRARPRTAADQADTPTSSTCSPTRGTLSTNACEAGSATGCVNSIATQPVKGCATLSVRYPKVSGCSSISSPTG